MVLIQGFLVAGITYFKAESLSLNYMEMYVNRHFNSFGEEVLKVIEGP